MAVVTALKVSYLNLTTRTPTDHLLLTSLFEFIIVACLALGYNGGEVGHVSNQSCTGTNGKLMNTN